MAYEFMQLLDNVRDSRFGTLGTSEECELTNVEILRERYDRIQRGVELGLIPETHEAPLGCQLELTYRCNSRCIHCYNDSSVERFKAAEEMTHEQWLDVARQLNELGVFQVVISGGEPLLLKDRLFEIMDVLSESGVVFVFITNGSLVTPKVVRRLATSGYRWSWLQVSIDGDTPEIHDHLRGHPGSWEKATRAVRLFAEAGLPITVAHTVTRANLDRFQEMGDLAVSLGARGMITGPCLPSGRAAANEEAQALLLTAAERARLDDEVVRARKRLCTTQTHGGKFWFRTGKCLSVSLRLRAIEPSNLLLVRPDGEVKVDCVLPFAIGNVRNADLRTIWREAGATIWRHPEVLEYISSIEQQEHVLEKDIPRPHVGESVRVS